MVFREASSLSRRELKAAAEGNPLYLNCFIEELVRTQILLGEIGEHFCVEEPANIRLPPSLHNLFEQRMKALNEPAARLLKYASIVGIEFELNTLSFLTGEEVHAHTPSFVELIKDGFIKKLSGFPSYRFAFIHALLHESVYRGLLAREIKTYHASLFFFLWKSRSGRDYELSLIQAAHHAHKAGLSWESLQYNYVAGRRMLRRSQGATAALNFERALEALKKYPGRKNLEDKCRLQLAIALSLQGKHEEARSKFDYSRESYRIANRNKSAAISRLASASILDLWIKGDLNGGVDRGFTFLQSITLKTDRYNFITIGIRVAGMLWDAGRYREAIELLHPISEALIEDKFSSYGLLHSASIMANALLAHCYSELGYFEAAIHCASVTSDLVDENPNFLTKIYGLIGVANVSLREKDFVRAVTLFQEIYEMSCFRPDKFALSIRCCASRLLLGPCRFSRPRLGIA